MERITESREALPEAGHDSGVGEAGPWVVVIDHHEARIFSTCEAGAKPVSVRPRQTEESISHAHSFSPFARGREKPLAERYFLPVCEALRSAGQLLVYGSGTGSSNMMALFIAWVARHRPQLAHRIIGAMKVNVSHLTDAQLLSLSRDHGQRRLQGFMVQAR